MRVAKVKQSGAAGHITHVNGTAGMDIALQNLNTPPWVASPTYNKCFRYYDLITDFVADMMNKDNIWVIYDLLGEEFTRNKQESYENIVCGFLQSCDLQGGTDHTIYFHWGRLDNVPRYCVAIFISPGPVQLGKSGIIPNEIDPPPAAGYNSNPPKPPPPPPPY